jgi:hypothetical protein
MPRAYITITNGQNLTQTEALRLIEQALREQAGLVVDEHFVVKPDDRARANK